MDEPIDNTVASTAQFKCPNCGKINQDDVVFLCNTCDSKEVEEVDGVYMCKGCKTAANPLMCRVCESKEVHMHGETVEIPGKDHPHRSTKE